MRITGMKVIQLNTQEKTLLTNTAHLLADLAEQIANRKAIGRMHKIRENCRERFVQNAY